MPFLSALQSQISPARSSVYHRVTGGGTLTVTNPTGAINVVQGGDNNDHFATLDLSGLTNSPPASVRYWLAAFLTSSQFGAAPDGDHAPRRHKLHSDGGRHCPTGNSGGLLSHGRYQPSWHAANVSWSHNVVSADTIAIGGTKTTGQILSRPGVASAYALIRAAPVARTGEKFRRG